MVPREKITDLRRDNSQHRSGLLVLFYTTCREVLGIWLLSRQLVEPHGFTLYLLASTTQSPPNADIDALENREWFWQRPYTTLELQHFWAGEQLRCCMHQARRSNAGVLGCRIRITSTRCIRETLVKDDYATVGNAGCNWRSVAGWCRLGRQSWAHREITVSNYSTRS